MFGRGNPIDSKVPYWVGGRGRASRKDRICPSFFSRNVLPLNHRIRFPSRHPVLARSSLPKRQRCYSSLCHPNQQCGWQLECGRKDSDNLSQVGGRFSRLLPFLPLGRWRTGTTCNLFRATAAKPLFPPAGRRLASVKRSVWQWPTTFGFGHRWRDMPKERDSARAHRGEPHTWIKEQPRTNSSNCLRSHPARPTRLLTWPCAPHDLHGNPHGFRQ